MSSLQQTPQPTSCTFLLKQPRGPVQRGVRSSVNQSSAWQVPVHQIVMATLRPGGLFSSSPFDRRGKGGRYRDCRRLAQACPAESFLEEGPHQSLCSHKESGLFRVGAVHGWSSLAHRGLPQEGPPPVPTAPACRCSCNAPLVLGDIFAPVSAAGMTQSQERERIKTGSSHLGAQIYRGPGRCDTHSQAIFDVSKRLHR